MLDLPCSVDLLTRFAESECKDPHDKIFGLLGLVKYGQNFDVNYAMGLTNLFWYTLDYCDDPNRSLDMEALRRAYKLLLKTL